MTEYEKILLNIKNTNKKDEQTLSDMLSACRLVGVSADGDAKYIYKTAVNMIAHTDDVKICEKYYDLARRTALYLASRWFEYYLIALEWNREPKKKFYMPRRRVLNEVVSALQELADRKLDFLGISLPPRVGKSTLCIMFMTWLMGKNPDTANVMSGHSDKLTDGFYREVLSIIADSETYCWHDIFPDIQIAETSAKNESIDLERVKRFSTLTCRTINGTLTGAVEIGEDGILYCDDLVEDLEESLNPERLQAKYDAYLNQLKDRKKDGARELMVGTRWNILDPLGRIQEQYEENPRYKFLVIPALNENDESNFDYDFGVGFSTEYYHDMRSSIDDATWWAKYMGSPYEREGLLFPREELRYYNGVLPDGDPDRIVGVCDVAWGGGDSLSMPIAYVYGDSVYLQDIVFNKGDKEVTRPLVVGMIKRHIPHQVEFEANNGGDEYADKVNELLKQDGILVSITSRKAPTNQAKLSRIIQVAPEIKKIYFIDEKHRNGEYKAFMNELNTFVITGKNPHDDAPDSLAMLINKLFYSISAIKVVKSLI